MVGSGATRVTTHNPVASKRQMVYKKLKENVKSSAASYLGALNEGNCFACFMDRARTGVSLKDATFQLGRNCYKPKLRGIDSKFLLAPATGTPEKELASLSPKLHAEDRNSTLLKRDLTEHRLSEKDGVANYLRLPNRLPLLSPNKDDRGAEWHSSQ